MTQPLHINDAHFLADLEALAQFGGTGNGVTRVAYSAIDLQARDWVDDRLRALGLRVQRDVVGNTIARLEGANSALQPIAIGSHTDTVPNGGKFDGALGVMAAVACARALRNHDVLLRHSLEVINFMAEEATMSGGTTGSQIMAGLFNPQQFEQQAWDGQLVASHFRCAGFEPNEWRSAIRERGSLAAYLELHIEQGEVLERAGMDIGIVEGMVSIRRYHAVFEGYANHAGTTPMANRRDALVMAAPFVLAVRDAAMRHDIVGTVGNLDVQPGAPNVIPGHVEMIVELRALHASRLNEVCAELTQRAQSIGGTLEEIVDKSPTHSDPHLLAAIESACDALGLSHLRMPSGAFHDAANMAALCPQAMIFVPSAGGVSHSPDEYTSPDDCVNGANVLLNALIRLDAE